MALKFFRRSMLLDAVRKRAALFGERPEKVEKLAPHLLLGRAGEEMAADFLRARGYRLVAANFSLQVGRNLRGAPVHAELDLVAYEGSTLCFVEVKTRASDRFASPEANVDLRKQRQITRAARAYRRLIGIPPETPQRFDVVSVIIPAADENGPVTAPTVELLKNFWTKEKFRKRSWNDSNERLGQVDL